MHAGRGLGDGGRAFGIGCGGVDLNPKTLERPKALILNWGLVLKISGFILWRYSLESCSYSPPGLGFWGV